MPIVEDTLPRPARQAAHAVDVREAVKQPPARAGLRCFIGCAVRCFIGCAALQPLSSDTEVERRDVRLREELHGEGRFCDGGSSLCSGDVAQVPERRHTGGDLPELVHHHVHRLEDRLDALLDQEPFVLTANAADRGCGILIDLQSADQLLKVLALLVTDFIHC